MSQISHIKAAILQKLLFSEGLRYSEIKPTNMESSHFKYYLDQLLADQLVTKSNRTYILTPKGKESANQMNTDENTQAKMPKVTSKLCCVKVTDGVEQILVYKRLKNPFYGHIGIPTHKVWYGETMIEAVTIGLTEECGLTGTPNLIGVRRNLVYYNDNLVEDKIFFVHLFSKISGEITNNRDGEYYWVDLKDCETVCSPPLPELSQILPMIQGQDQEYYREYTIHTDTF